MSTHKQEIMAQLNNEVQSIGRDWMGDLIDCHNYDPAMAQLTVVEAIVIWCENVNPKELLEES